MKKSKIILLQGQIGVNGVFYLNKELARQFSLIGHEVHFVTQDVSPSLEFNIPKSCTILRIGNCRPRTFLFRLIKIILKERPNALIASGWPYSALSILAVRLMRFKCKIIVVEHVDFRTNLDASGEYTKKDKFLIASVAGRIYKLADAVVGVSQGVVDGLKYATKVSLTNTHVIYNPIRQFESNNSDFSSIALLEKVWTKKTKKILSVGRLAKQKSIETLINAIELLKNIDDLVLVVAGEGGERSRLEDIIRKKQLENRIFLIGEVADPSILYKRADLFVLSSSSEGFANVILEALYFGVPVVSTNCMSGPAEILENGRWGRLVPVGNAYELAEAIRLSLCEKTDKKELKLRAEAFSSEHIAAQYMALLT